MAVTGAKHWWVAALIGGYKFRQVKLERDEAIIKQLIDNQRHFWEHHVLRKVPPQYDALAASDLLGRLYPKAESEHLSQVQLPQEANKWVEQFIEAELEEKSVLLRKNEAVNHLKSLLGDTGSGIARNYSVTWKNVRRRGNDEQSHRRFLIKPLKETGKLQP